MTAYYNEFDPKAAQWLRELIKHGHIAPGDVDERSIKDVKASDLDGYTQCHFFAGIGGWSHALRLAAWPDELPVWTGSCPCQPFSDVGRGLGEDDPRHLWPDFRDLVGQCGPPVIFGEQVASKAGREWYSGVRADLETLGYASGAADLCAACAGTDGEGWIVQGDSASWEPIVIGAPHIRQRLFWVAYSSSTERYGWAQLKKQPGALLHATDCSPHGRLPNASVHCSGPGLKASASTGDRRAHSCGCGGLCRLEDTNRSRPQGHARHVNDGDQPGRQHSESDGSQRPAFWADFRLVDCRDNKTRRLEPSIEPLVDGLPGRVGLLRGYGNAIVPQVAAIFIEAARDSLEVHP